MSHLHIYNSYFYYDPVLLGHPHEQPEQQLTEPFWQQYPPWTQPDNLPNPYYQSSTEANMSSHIMDTEPLKIGSRTQFAPRFHGPNKNNGNNNIKSDRPMGKVEVYINDQFIQEMPLGTLVRFSKVAAVAFPKPESTKETTQTKSEDAVKVDGKGTVDTSPAQGASSDTTTNRVQGASSSTVKKDHGNSPNKKLNLYLDSLWYQPNVEAFKFVFGWMHEAKIARHGQSVIELGVPEPEEVSLQKLVDYRAAALCLDLRPAPHKHVHTLMARITQQRPLLLDVQYVHEHLPIDDTVMTRMITSFFEHSDYSKVELNAVENYVVDVDPALTRRFARIQASRVQKCQEQRLRQGEARLQELAEGTSGMNLGEAAKTEASTSAAGKR